MARDYAQRGGGRRQARGRSGGTPGWSWLAVGLAIGLAFAAVVYIKRPTSP
ncbi:UNVERIFIED_CONTAM: SPOR domain-containing protein, partial [Salmonella enterica subsp. enterica serovar Weltevreden]